MLHILRALVVLFPKETQELFAFSPVGVGFLFITGTWWIPHIYRETRGRYGKPIPILPLHKDLELLRIDEWFILPKATDVLFQQTAIALVITLVAPSVPVGALILVFALLFLLFHLGLVLKMSLSWALYFALSAGIGGMLIPVFVLYVPGGIYYLITFHLLWYTFSGSWYWKKRAK